MASRRVSIEKLAPTGEGISRGPDGIGFIERALPGEEIDAEVRQVHSRFWRGRAVAVVAASPDRRGGAHAESCPACDWAHFDLSAAREAKRALFVETLARLGGVALPGPIGVAASPPRYRLRNRFHVAGRGRSAVLGYFLSRTHEVEPLVDCDSVSRSTLNALVPLREGIAASGCPVVSVATLETADEAARIARITLAGVPEAGAGAIRELAHRVRDAFAGVRVVTRQGRTLGGEGEDALPIMAAGRRFQASAGAFFQGNRYLLDGLAAEVGAAADVPAGEALDAYGGVGLFAAPLLAAGHAVTTVEGDREAVENARRTRSGWTDGKAWEIVPRSLETFLAQEERAFDVVVADPPRIGLSAALAGELARRTRSRFVYVSCEPSTLARDLRVILAEGFELSRVALFDLFALTHRIEAVVTLDRRPTG